MCQVSKPASSATAAINRAATQSYDMDDRHDFVDAHRGLIAALPGQCSPRRRPHVVFDPAEFDYLR